jgi:hypothetical protein
MRKYFTEIVLVFILLLSVNSCEYEPSGVHDRNIQKDANPPQIQTVELNITSDSIFLYNYWNIRFQFQCPDHNINGVRLLVDSIEIGRVNSDAGTFEVLPYYFDVGVHDLRMEIYTNAGTGSIGDILGIEGYVFWHKWKLVIRGSYNNDLKYGVRNGLLNISWARYDATNFKEYVVIREDNSYNAREIWHSTNTDFTDSTYAGEGGRYLIYARTDESDVIIADLYFNREIPTVTYSSDTLNNLILSWNRSKYYNAVDSVILFLGTSDVSYSRAGPAFNAFDTTFSSASVGSFGDMLFAKIKVVPKRENVMYMPEAYYRFESIAYPVVGFPFPAGQFIQDLYRVARDEFVYVQKTDGDYLVRYSVSKKGAVEEISDRTMECPSYFIGVQTSPAGKYLISFIGCYQQPMITKSSDLAAYSMIGQVNQYGSPGLVSDKGIGLICDFNYRIYLYDFINSNMLGIYDRSPRTPIPMKLSSAGDYFLERDDSIRLVHFNGTGFSRVTSLRLTDNYGLFKFHPFNTDQIIYWDNSVFSVRRCDDFSTIYDFPLSESLLDIDFYNDEILTFTTGHLYIRSIQNGSLISDIPVNFVPQTGSTCYLVNHTIVYTKGLMYFVK